MYTTVDGGFFESQLLFLLHFLLCVGLYATCKRKGPVGLFFYREPSSRIFGFNGLTYYACRCIYELHPNLLPNLPTWRYNPFRSTAISKQRVLAAAPPEKSESDGEYESDVDEYHPVQPLVHDHGVSFVCLSSAHTKIDQHVMQVRFLLELNPTKTSFIWEPIISARLRTINTLKQIR